MNRLRLFPVIMFLIIVGLAGTVMASLNGASASVVTDTIELVSKIGGTTNSIAIQGNYAYLGEANWLSVVDVSVPTRPVIVGRSTELHGTVSGLAVAGQYAYVVSSEDTLHIVDIADPSAPGPVGLFEGYAFRGDPVVNENTVLLSAERTDVQEYGLLLIDVSNPLAPVESGFFPTKGSIIGVAATLEFAFVVVSSYYTENEQGGPMLYSINIVNPASPVAVGSLELADPSGAIAMSGQYLYLISDSNLKIIDVSDPSALASVGSLDVTDNFYHMAVSGKNLYLNTSSSGLKLDISAPSTPKIAGSDDFVSQIVDMAFVGDKVFASEWDNGFAVYHVADPKEINRIGHIPLIQGSAYGLDIDNGYVYLPDSMQILDVSDPQNPFIDGMLDINLPYDTSIKSVDVEGDSALFNLGFWFGADFIELLADMSNRTKPKIVAGLSIPYFANLSVSDTRILMDQQRAFVLRDCEFTILSLAVLSNPTLLATHDLSKLGICGDLFISGSLAYLINTTTLSILDMTDPKTPIIVGKVDLPDREWSDVTISGNYAFLEENGKGLTIIDISDETAPAEVGYLTFPDDILFNNITCIASEGHYAYICGNFDNLISGLSVVDLSSPSAPEEVAHYSTQNCSSLKLSGGLIYCNGWDSLLILRHQKDEAPPILTPTAPASPAGERVYLPTAQNIGNYRWPNTARISIDSAGRQANGKSTATDMTPDGRYIVFDSEATNLVIGDTNGKSDVFIHDRDTRQTTRISVSSDGTQGDNISWGGRISADGRYIVFNSYATSLVPDDTNNLNDIFIYDLRSRQTSRLSLTATGQEANGRSRGAAISPDGRYVAFESMATNLDPVNFSGTGYGIFLLDRQTHRALFIDSGENPAISIDGLFVAYESAGLFIFDRLTGQKKVVELNSYEELDQPGHWESKEVSGYSMAVEGHKLSYSVWYYRESWEDDSFSYYKSFLYDAQKSEYIYSSVSESIGTMSPNGDYLVYDGIAVLDTELRLGWLLGISATNQLLTKATGFTNISNDGRIALFDSDDEDVVPNDTNSVQDVFIRDRGTP